ncbi:hypothetical protein GFY24_17370 [Nocardia sp. SYP-A9097]|uniref:hypothetical protein n=1 Tax=Nocardia sp. SYP-A9097 TaxID=2663237 RepID=UPI00129A7828|nr:hypothetical protein [Nocardia sp. SYP-A9097]MRH89198.1 hypothetical protein [Nocardia sp. SYP-A9097]
MEIIVLIAALALVLLAATATFRSVSRAHFDRDHLTVNKIQARLAAERARAVPAVIGWRSPQWH